MKLTILLFIMILLGCTPSKKNTESVSPGKEIIGTWKYIEDQLLDAQNNILARDNKVDGLLIYTPEGKVSMQFYWRGVREPILNDTIMNKNGKSTGLGMGSNTWSLEETRKLIDSYKAYFGNYAYDPEHHVITHTSLGNIRPEKEGAEYSRNIFVRNDTLLLSNINPQEHWRAVCIKVK